MSEYGYLMHHGVKGMRWGVRNYQNADGSLTAEGRARYYNADGTRTKAGTRYEAKQYAAQTKIAYKEAKANLKDYRIQSLKKVGQRGPIKGAAAYISGSKGLKAALKNAKNDKYVANNVFNSAKEKLKYRDSSRDEKTKMAFRNKVTTEISKAVVGTAVRVLAKDAVKAAIATHAQKGQQAMNGANVASLFAKNMSNELNKNVKTFESGIETIGSIAKVITKKRS